MRRNRFSPKELLIVDVESTGLEHWKSDEMFAISMSDENGNTYYREWEVDPFTRKVSPDEKDLEFLGNLFSEKKLQTIGHNIKFDQRCMAKMGLRLAGIINDTLIMARICNTLENTYKLKPLCVKYLGVPDDDKKELQQAVVKARREGKKRGWKLAEDVHADYWLPRALDSESRVCERYAVADVHPRCHMLYRLYRGIMEKDRRDGGGLLRTYQEEMELWPIVMEMETRGVAIDPVLIGEELERHRANFIRYREELRQMCGKPDFSPGSNPQLAKVLFQKKPEGLGLKPVKLTAAGNESTDWKALGGYAWHPFVRKLEQWKEAKKAIEFFEAYTDLRIPDHLNEGGVCLHPSFNQVGALTLRFSCQSPNLQQAAKK